MVEDKKDKIVGNKTDSSPVISGREEKILDFWSENEIFKRSLKQTKGKKTFIFYEGPPYANGRPGIHHVLARSFKDVVLRFKTMNGFNVPRRAGWDTHGLPTEMEVEKKLGINTKKKIEEFGIDKFVEEARKNVFYYKDEWEKMTRRMAYWLDLEHPYITMSNGYVRSLWRVFSEISKNGYLYKDYKVLPWCVRCGTSLSSHELAQGYKKIKDVSIYVKFPIKSGSGAGGRKIYFLAWTTTPWTLPGNSALAINEKERYVTVEHKGEWLILAKDRLGVLDGEHREILQQKGKQLVGMQYDPLYPQKISDKNSAYRVIAADFVSMSDGSGVVHIAPAFGADDQKVGKENGLPTLVTVSEDGKMRAPGSEWNDVLFLDANPMIRKDLEDRGLIYKSEPYEHDYPFCWRCKSALMYYAKDSWFLKTTAVKKEMIEENKKIGWHPEHVGKSRFGEWLRENVDWAISRERYWGMPLPVWICKTCGHQDIISSLEELNSKQKPHQTEVYVVRHGEATHNVKGIVGPAIEGSKFDRSSELTSRGERQAEEAAKKLFKKKIDIIISSPLARTRKTSKIIADIIGAKVEIDDRLHDINIGDFHGEKVEDVRKKFPFEKILVESFPGGESVRHVRARMFGVFKDIIFKYKDKKILIVSHGDPLWVLNAALDGVEEEDYKKSWYPKTGEIRRFNINNWPYSIQRGELDIHRPYIDDISLRCSSCGGDSFRIKEVADVWFDSGAMPFAQNQDFPGKIGRVKVNLNKLKKTILYPADYICEGIDQTRGWFYTLLAVSSLMELPSAYKNVLTIGLVLDQKGEKMSKSKGNIVEPFQLFEKYGVDAVRWYFYTINQPSDEKLFRESDVADASRKFIMILKNTVEYWKTYSIVPKIKKAPRPKMAINKWLIINFEKVKYDSTKAMDKFDIVTAARLIGNFVLEDVSRWYIRRIREVMKIGNKPAKKETSETLGYVLSELSKIIAPFTPFIAEDIYLLMAGFDLDHAKTSVHLEKWPGTQKPVKDDLLKDMNELRKIVGEALKLRAESGIKVRQPLGELKIRGSYSGIRKNKQLIDLMKGELNIKKISFGVKINKDIELDLNITPELKEEGIFRDLVRHIQDMRKKSGLMPKDKIVLSIASKDPAGKFFVKKFEERFKEEVNAGKLVTDAIKDPQIWSIFKTDELEFDVSFVL